MSSKLDQLINKVKSGQTEFKAPQKAIVEPKKAKPKKQEVVTSVNSVPEKNLDEVKEMFHFLMFQNRMKTNERILVGPMYNKLCETGRLSPAQKSFIANLWINYQSKACCGE